MAARFVEPVHRDQAERISAAVDETLVALEVDLDVPVTVLPRHAAGGEANVFAWANSRTGLHVPADVLDLPDRRLRQVVVEETGHYFHGRAHPRVAASPLHAELFAIWLVGHVVGKMSMPAQAPENPSLYQLGQYAGAALAGADAARDALKAWRAGGVLRMVGRLEKQLGEHPDPQALAGLLVGELGGR